RCLEFSFLKGSIAFFQLLACLFGNTQTIGRDRRLPRFALLFSHFAMKHNCYLALSPSGLHTVENRFFNVRTNDSQPVYRLSANPHSNLPIGGRHLFLKRSSGGIL